MTIEILDEGTGTPKYLVLDQAEDPFVAQNLHEVLEDIFCLDKARIFLLTPEGETTLVEFVEHDPGDLGGFKWGVCTVDGNHLVEYIEYDEDARDDQRATVVHDVHVIGWPS